MSRDQWLAGAAQRVHQLQAITTPLAVNHQGQFPSVTISFNLSPDIRSAMRLIESIRRAQQIGCPRAIHGSFSGTAQAYQDSLANEPILVVAAILAVYIVLGILYESLIHPITILSTLPSAGVARCSHCCFAIPI